MSSWFVSGGAGGERREGTKGTHHVPVAGDLDECFGGRWGGRREGVHPFLSACCGIEGRGLDGRKGEMIGCAVVVGE